MTVDFAACRMRLGKPRHFHVGTLFFNRTAGARALLKQWAAAMDSVTSDEAALDRLWKSGGWPGTVAELPSSYFTVLGRTRVGKDSVVMHRLSKAPAKYLAKARFNAAKG